MKKTFVLFFLTTLILGSCKKADLSNQDQETNGSKTKKTGTTHANLSYNWSNVAIGGGGFVSGIITGKTAPYPMYARTDVGGAYRFDRATSTWIPLMDWASDQQSGMYAVESMAIDPQNPNIVYAYTGISYFNDGRSYILRSADYGNTFSITEVTSQFKAHGNGSGRQNGEKLQVDPNNSAILYCGTRYNGLFKSTNSGSSWTRLSGLNVTTTANGAGVSFVLLDKSSVAGGSTQRIFAGISRPGNGKNQNFYVSNNGGASFTAISHRNLGSGLMPQRATFTGDGNLVITYADGAGPSGVGAGQIWKYNIGSGSWTNISPPTHSGAFSGISVDPQNPQRIVATSINSYQWQGSAWGDRFFLSTNGGSTWTDVVARGFTKDNNGADWAEGVAIHWVGCIEFDPSNTARVLVTSGHGIFVNENINTSGTWKFTVKGLEETVPLSLISIPGGPLISGVGDYSGFRHTDINQYAPQVAPAFSDLAYAYANPNKVVRVGEEMYYSNDMGLTWTKTTSINGTWGKAAVSTDGNTILHSPDGSSMTYISTNNGNSWNTVSGLSFTSAWVHSDGLNVSKFYAYDSNTGKFYVSTNGGSTFTVTPGAPGSWGSKRIAIAPGMEGRIWIALYDGGLSYSETSGTSFSKLTNVTSCTAVGIGKSETSTSDETVYIYGTVGGVKGIFRSTNKGLSWDRVNDDAHEFGGPANGQFVVGDMNTFGRVYMSTAGRGIVVGTPN
ncbi:MAG: exo-alpha-sialidase [Sphingobacteriaceae bacterium]|nr:exo-alpha-sialidase [Sphingobacteriaceae bacterium]